eukprot:5644780-Amphidinium_carterae.2
MSIKGASLVCGWAQGQLQMETFGTNVANDGNESCKRMRRSGACASIWLVCPSKYLAPEPSCRPMDHRQASGCVK